MASEDRQDSGQDSLIAGETVRIDRLYRSCVERLIDILDSLNSGFLEILTDKLPSMIKHIDMVDQLAGFLGPVNEPDAIPASCRDYFSFRF
jgi:hypothetical protein